MKENSSVFDSFLTVILLIIVIGGIYFLFVRRKKQEEPVESPLVPQSPKKMELKSSQIEEVVKSWLRQIGINNESISSLKDYAKKQILEDLMNVIKNPSLPLKEKKEKILEIADKEYKINEKIEELVFPEELKTYDTVKLGSFSYFFREYNIPEEDISPQNLEEKLKALFRKIYTEGISLIKDSEIFLHIKYLKDKNIDEEIQRKLDDIKLEIEYQLKKLEA